MQSNPTDDSQNQKQSDEAWIIRGRGGNRRKIHSRDDCWQLETADRGVRQASTSEVQAHAQCGWCDPDREVDHARTEDRMHAKLLKMDPDDVGFEAQS